MTSEQRKQIESLFPFLTEIKHDLDKVCNDVKCPCCPKEDKKNLGPRKCDCDISVLMVSGCKCGGK